MIHVASADFGNGLHQPARNTLDSCQNTWVVSCRFYHFLKRKASRFVRSLPFCQNLALKPEEIGPSSQEIINQPFAGKANQSCSDGPTELKTQTRGSCYLDNEQTGSAQKQHAAAEMESKKMRKVSSRSSVYLHQ